MSDFLNQHPWIKQVARDVLIALLISLLTVLGYDVGVVRPRMAALAWGAMPPDALPRSATGISSLKLSGGLTLAPGAATTLTDGATFAPSRAAHPLDSAGDVGVSLAAGSATAGDLLLLYNTADTTITITDTGTAKLAGDAGLGQHDALLLIYDGAHWIELARSDN